MAKFIKLTRLIEGTTILVDICFVCVVDEYKSGSTLFFNDRRWCEVKESPEEIMRVLEE